MSPENTLPPDFGFKGDEDVNLFFILGVDITSCIMAAARERIASGEDDGRGVKVNLACFFRAAFRVWTIFT